MKPLQTSEEYQELLEVQIKEAKRNPRELALIKEALMSRISDENIPKCFYCIPTSTGVYTGFSIFFVQELLSYYKNLNVFCQVVEQNSNLVKVQVMAHDLETNRIMQEEVVRAISFTSKRYNDSQLNASISAAMSIGKRQAVLTLVPRTFLDSVWEWMEEYINDNIDIDQEFFERIKEDRLTKFTKLELCGIKYSCENNDSKLSDFFPPTMEDLAESLVMEKLKKNG